jgi:hypothetical protein
MAPERAPCPSAQRPTTPMNGPDLFASERASASAAWPTIAGANVVAGTDLGSCGYNQQHMARSHVKASTQAQTGSRERTKETSGPTDPPASRLRPMNIDTEPVQMAGGQPVPTERPRPRTQNQAERRQRQRVAAARRQRLAEQQLRGAGRATRLLSATDRRLKKSWQKERGTGTGPGPARIDENTKAALMKSYVNRHNLRGG